MEKKDFGLVFAGGGGKGAYQIGVWKALRLLHMDTWIKGVSGDSVGALNAVLFTNGDYEKAEAIWKNIHPIQFLDITPDGVCSRDGLTRILDREINLRFVSNSALPTFINITECPPVTDASMKLDAALACTMQDPADLTGEYLQINGREPEEIKKILLASSALPIVYEPVQIGGKWYRDGGLFDNMPMRPLLDMGLTNLILVKLSQDAEYDVFLASRADTLIEITPSGDIGHLLTGTLDFDSQNVAYRLQMGFYDTLRTFEFYERKMLGFPVSPAEKAKRIADDLEKVRSFANVSNVMHDVNRNKNTFDSILKKYHIDD